MRKFTVSCRPLTKEELNGKNINDICQENGEGLAALVAFMNSLTPEELLELNTSFKPILENPQPLLPL